MRRCSLVVPEGPAAEPRRALRKHRRKSCKGSGHGSAGTCRRTLSGKGAYGTGGRRSGSRSSASVSRVPAAKGWAVRACPAADSSPMWTRAAARRARCASEGSVRGGPGTVAAAAADWRRRSDQCPARNSSHRLSNSADGMRDSPGKRNRSMRGARQKSFQPRAASSGATGWTASRRPVRSAVRNAPRMRAGADCSVRTR